MSKEKNVFNCGTLLGCLVIGLMLWIMLYSIGTSIIDKIIK